MLKSQKLMVSQSEAREKINGLLGLETLDDSQRTELEGLTKRMQELEVEFRAAIVSEPDPETRANTTLDSEARERAALREKVRVTDYLACAMEMRSLDGAASEYNAAVGIGRNAFPLELLAHIEERETTDTDSGRMQQTWLDRLFSETAATRLGISTKSVPAGTTSFPITTAGASGAQRGRTEAASAAAWTVSVTELKPTRNAVHCVFSIEDAARLDGLESALQRDLSAALVEGIDRNVFLGDATGNGTAADITGLQTASITETTLTQANKVKGPETLSAFAAMIDGKHAAGFGDLNIVSSVGAWRLWESSIVNSSADNMTLGAFLRAAGLDWASRGDIDSNTANGDFGAFVGRNRGIADAGVIAVWE